MGLNHIKFQITLMGHVYLFPHSKIWKRFIDITLYIVSLFLSIYDTLYIYVLEKQLHIKSHYSTVVFCPVKSNILFQLISILKF